jgi:polysaccharide export outer membrane protein
VITITRRGIAVAIVLAMPARQFGQELQPRIAEKSGTATGLRLGPGDHLNIWVRDATEINGRSYRIEDDGQVRVPMVGLVPAGGLTTAELEQTLLKRLTSIIIDPDVTVSVAELRTRPVTVVGSVKQPGTVQLRDRITLLQAISAAGGVSNDAGNTVRMTRKKEYGPIPLTTAIETEDGEFSTVEADLGGILNGTSPAANVIVQPNDVINVLQAPVIYVMGEVKRSGGLALSRKDSEISVLQALAMAEGMTPTAAGKKALILRPSPGAVREAVAIDLKALLAGKVEDLRLRPNDILFVPDNRSTAKTVALQAAQVAASIAVGVSIVRAGQQRR